MLSSVRAAAWVSALRALLAGLRAQLSADAGAALPAAHLSGAAAAYPAGRSRADLSGLSVSVSLSMSVSVSTVPVLIDLCVCDPCVILFLFYVIKDPFLWQFRVDFFMSKQLLLSKLIYARIPKLVIPTPAKTPWVLSFHDE